MCTTLTLDEDVIRQLEKEQRRTGQSFKEVVNRCLRAGLSQRKPQQPGRFVVTPRKLGLPAGLSYDNIAELLEALEGPLHR